MSHVLGSAGLEPATKRLVPHPYDPQRRAKAEEIQIENVRKVKRNRSNREVTESLKHIREAATDEKMNLIPVILEAVKSYVTIGEICGVLREVFGEYRSFY